MHMGIGWQPAPRPGLLGALGLHHRGRLGTFAVPYSHGRFLDVLFADNPRNPDESIEHITGFTAEDTTSGPAAQRGGPAVLGGLQHQADCSGPGNRSGHRQEHAPPSTGDTPSGIDAPRGRGLTPAGQPPLAAHGRLVIHHTAPGDGRLLNLGLSGELDNSHW